jgi:hypothetical protein
MECQRLLLELRIDVFQLRNIDYNEGLGYMLALLALGPLRMIDKTSVIG